MPSNVTARKQNKNVTPKTEKGFSSIILKTGNVCPLAGKISIFIAIQFLSTLF